MQASKLNLRGRGRVTSQTEDVSRASGVSWGAGMKGAGGPAPPAWRPLASFLLCTAWSGSLPLLGRPDELLSTRPSPAQARPPLLSVSFCCPLSVKSCSRRLRWNEGLHVQNHARMERRGFAAPRAGASASLPRRPLPGHPLTRLDGPPRAPSSAVHSEVWANSAASLGLGLSPAP